jgi:hypothetical protein
MECQETGRATSVDDKLDAYAMEATYDRRQWPKGWLPCHIDECQEMKRATGCKII